LREEHGLRVFENRVLRRVLRERKRQNTGEDYIMRSYISRTLHRMLSE